MEKTVVDQSVLAGLFEEKVDETISEDRQFPNTREAIVGFLTNAGIEADFDVEEGTVDIGDEGSPYRIDAVRFKDVTVTVTVLVNHCVGWDFTIQDVTIGVGIKGPYGGIRTLMSTLDVGTKFHVCNGAWNGEVIEKDGEKYILIQGDRRDRALKIEESYTLDIRPLTKDEAERYGR